MLIYGMFPFSVGKVNFLEIRARRVSSVRKKAWKCAPVFSIRLPYACFVICREAYLFWIIDGAIEHNRYYIACDSIFSSTNRVNNCVSHCTLFFLLIFTIFKRMFKIKVKTT
jgi:hypothetical protein